MKENKQEQNISEEKGRFTGIHPWRADYFKDILIPSGTVIPLDDPEAYRLFPEYSWLYNKLMICEMQDFACGPDGINPEFFPVFVKPIYNLRGFGAGSGLATNESDYKSLICPGRMWMTSFSGDHISTDIALDKGRVVWLSHTKGTPASNGVFDVWQTGVTINENIKDNICTWAERIFCGFTGIINIETIDGGIIEVHLRMASQYIDLYPHGWLNAVVSLYAGNGWPIGMTDYGQGFSLPIVIPHGNNFHIDRSTANTIAARYSGILSLQLPSGQENGPKKFASPPGGLITGFINCTDLEQGKKLRDVLKEIFISKPEDSANKTLYIWK